MRPPGVLDLAPGIIAGYLPVVLVVVAVLGIGLYVVRSRSLPRSEAAGPRRSTSAWGCGSPSV